MHSPPSRITSWRVSAVPSTGPTGSRCEEVLRRYFGQLARLAGKVDLLVGGPPCQGFSTAGRRDPSDPRNRLAEHYLEFVRVIKPRFIVLENVAGFNIKFGEPLYGQNEVAGTGKGSYAAYVASRLGSMGYRVFAGLVNCADFGVPQIRRRFASNSLRRLSNSSSRSSFCCGVRSFRLGSVVIDSLSTVCR